jgi:hypothetical protein
MKKRQWPSMAAMANHSHDDDKGKQDAQTRRIRRRKQVVKN